MYFIRYLPIIYFNKFIFTQTEFLENFRIATNIYNYISYFYYFYDFFFNYLYQVQDFLIITRITRVITARCVTCGGGVCITPAPAVD